MEKANSNQIKSSLLLLMASIVWGAAFVAQSLASNSVGTFTFNGLRFIIGGLCLLPFLRGKVGEASDRHGNPFGSVSSDENRKLKGLTGQDSKKINRHIRLPFSPGSFIGGAICGIALFLASTFQQAGIVLGAAAGEAGFLTACYIVLVPILGIFIGRKCSFLVWPAVLLALFGLYLLCIPTFGAGISLSAADLSLLMCALLFSIQILCVDRYAPMMNPVALSCIQFFVCGAVSLAAALIFELLPDPAAWIMSLSTASAWIAILYTGIFSCGVGYTLQALGQRSLNPALASLIMSLESVFSTIFGWLILHQTMTGKELAGCALIFAAVLLAQIPVRRA